MSKRIIINRILHTTTLGLLLVLSLSLLSSLAEAAPNYQINYQGKLLDSSGSPVANGLYDMEFKLYTVPTGGSAIWTETRTGGNQVMATSGLFSVMLGEVASLSGVDFDQTLYLGVNIEGDGEMSPRKVLGSVPAAFEAAHAADSDTVGGVASSSFLRSDAADTASGLLTFTGGLVSTASSTITDLTFTTATATTLVINGEAFTDFTGTALVNTGGVLSVSTSSLAVYFASTSDFNTEAKLESILTDVTNIYTNNDGSLSDDDLSNNSTTDLAEGTNLYFTTARASTTAAQVLFATTTLPNLTTLANLSTVGTITSGTWNGTAIGDAYLTKTGDWTGTFDGQEGSYYLNADNLTNLDASDIALTNGYVLRGSAGGTAEATSSLFITDAGNVGIGTTTPDYPLEVVGRTELHGITVVDGRSTSVDGPHFTVSDDANLPLFDISSSFGQTFINSNKNARFFDSVYLADELQDVTQSAGSNGYILQSTGTSTLWTDPTSLGFIATTSGNWTGTFDGQEGSYYLDLANATGDTDDLTEGSTNLFSQWGTSGSNVYYNSGNVGIGTTSPQTTLHVSDTSAILRLDPTGASGDASIQYYADAAARWSSGVDNDDSYKYKISTGSALGSGEALTIDTSGNIGIGTTTPDQILTVAGNAYITGGATTSDLYVTDTFSGAGLTACSGSASKLLWSSTTQQFVCGADAGAGGGITALGVAGSYQSGSTQTLATSSDTNLELTIVSSGDTHTFTPVWNGTLAVGRGGTGAGSFNAGELLVGNGTGALTSTTTAGLKATLALDNVENTALSTWLAQAISRHSARLVPASGTALPSVTPTSPRPATGPAPSTDRRGVTTSTPTISPTSMLVILLLPTATSFVVQLLTLPKLPARSLLLTLEMWGLVLRRQITHLK
ncbi:hypothetical protein H6783_02225 [Candidatus Nomurabacteria bacterium]|nr:hypothetical protein [Candidatus Nomurabacteria bacterium]